MPKEAIHVTVDEFADHLEQFLARVIQDRETVVVEDAAGEQVEIRPARATRRRSRAWKPNAAELAAFRAAAGSWSNVDVDAFLRDNAASRQMSSRPSVEL